MDKVFGIGWTKTGRTTLGKALTTLGYRPMSQRMDLLEDIMRRDFSRIWQVTQRTNAFEDWPWTLIYRELAERYPDAKFVLTSRCEAAWPDIYRAMIRDRPSTRQNIEEIRRFIYGFDVSDASDEMLNARVRAHNDQVKEWFAAKPNRLLVVDWGAGDGWAQLCSFLRRPVPRAPFPYPERPSRPAGSLLSRTLQRLSSARAD